jgi:hypothetical protein
VIRDMGLAGEYKENWERRRAVSEPYAGALPAAPSPMIEAVPVQRRARRSALQRVAAAVSCTASCLDAILASAPSKTGPKRAVPSRGQQRADSGRSRATLSSLMPLNAGCRTRPSRVHWVNSISQTRRGLRPLRILRVRPWNGDECEVSRPIHG